MFKNLIKIFMDEGKKSLIGFALALISSVIARWNRTEFKDNGDFDNLNNNQIL